MKVLYLVTGIRPPLASGSEFIQNLILEISKKGINATIISPIYIHTEKNMASWAAKKEKMYHIRFILIDTPAFIKKNFLLHIVITPILTTVVVFRTLLKEKFDIVHEFTSTPIIILRSLIYKCFNIPSVFSLVVFNRTILGKFFWFKIFDFGSAYLIPSYEIMDKMTSLGIERQKIFYLPPAINITNFKPKTTKQKARNKLNLPNDKIIFIYFGQLSEEKGVFDIINAFKLLTKDVQNKIFIALYCSYLKGFTRHEKEAKKIRGKLYKNVKLYEKYVDIPLILTASDYVLYPQRTGHGTTIPPISVIETLVAHKPIIATNIIGVRELITKDNGLLVTPANPHALSKAISETSYNRTKFTGNTRLNEFNLANVTARLSSIYKKLSKK